MSRQEAQAELAARWGAPTLMRAAVDEYMQVRDWLPESLQVADWDRLEALDDDGGKAA
jgi:hypothetical protein